jgi:hypothetical protein
MNYKRGFSVDLYSKDLGIRTWSSTSVGATMGFLALYEEIDKQLSANQGKVAVIEYTGSDAKPVGKGNTRVPKFKVLGWRSDDSFEFTAEPDATSTWHDKVEETPLDLNGSATVETDEIPF